MSEFDKEAERERLREKFARDEEKRADTKRMSELLLKGATMTNRHCDACGDPIFRYEGQEFCPTCQGREMEAAEAASPEQRDEAGGPVETPAAAESEESAAASPATTGTPSDRETASDAAAGAEPARPDAAPTPRPDANGQTPSDVDVAQARQRGGTGDLSDARTSLVRALSTHAAAAESTSDPRVARDHLAAAREAAEALRALDGR
jgi:uncharacterized Zn finger protein (UPF0148 family)